MINPLYNIFFLKIDIDAASKIKVGGKELFLDTHFNRYHHAVQWGIVEGVPKKVHPQFRYDVEIKKGDKVYFHHFIAHKDNEIQVDGLFGCNYGQLYCIARNGEIQMLEEYILVKPVMESEEQYKKQIGDITLFLKANPEEIKQYGVVHHVPKQAAEWGLEKGDCIFFDKNCEYEMTIEGEKYYRMKLSNVLVVLRNTEMIPLSDRVLCKPVPVPDQEKRDSGLVMVNLKPKRFQDGIVLGYGKQVHDLKKKDRIMFQNGTQTVVNMRNETFLFLRTETVLGVYTD